MKIYKTILTHMGFGLQEIYRVGGRRLVVVGVPPMGCMPLVRTIFGGSNNNNTCADTYNKVASSFNSKIQKELATITSTLGMKTAFVDAYALVLDAVNHPQKFG